MHAYLIISPILAKILDHYLVKAKLIETFSQDPYLVKIKCIYRFSEYLRLPGYS